MMDRGLFEFSRQIRLAPAIGDWTTIQYRDADFEEINISPVYNINFDSLPKAELKYVHYIHYRLAEYMTQKLSQDMNIKVELHSIVASQMSYDEFLRSREDQTVQSDFVLGEEGRVNVLFDWSLAEMIVDRLTGGKGESSDQEEFNELEQSILQAQLDEVLPFFVKSWKSVFQESDIQVEFSCGRYVHDKKISLREAYIMFSVYFFFGDGDLRRMTFGYPNHILRRLLRLRNAKTDPVKQRIGLYPRTMSTVKVPVKAVLGQATLTMAELKNLQTGDIIPLNTQLDEPLKIMLGDKTVLSAQPGVVKDQLAMQVLLLEGEHQTLASPVLPFKKKDSVAEDMPGNIASDVVEDALPMQEKGLDALQDDMEVANPMEMAADSAMDGVMDNDAMMDVAAPMAGADDMGEYLNENPAPMAAPPVVDDADNDLMPDLPDLGDDHDLTVAADTDSLDAVDDILGGGDEMGETDENDFSWDDIDG